MRELTESEVEQVSGGTITSGAFGAIAGLSSGIASGGIAGAIWGARVGGLVGAGVGAVVGIGYTLATEDDS